VQPLICVVYNKLVITIRLIFKTSSVRQLLYCGSTSGPQRMAQRQLNDAPDAILSCGIETEI